MQPSMFSKRVKTVNIICPFTQYLESKGQPSVRYISNYSSIYLVHNIPGNRVGPMRDAKSNQIDPMIEDLQLGRRENR